MLRILSVVLYTAFVAGANPALAEDTAATPAAFAAAEAAREGDMRKLTFSDPRPLPATTLRDAADAPVSLDAFRGKWLVVNFWATWCAPCRHEMPSLDRLQTAMPDIAVLPVATGRNAVPAIAKFFDEAGVANLPVLRDPKSELARAMGVMGLPVTLIVNPAGEEVARLIGDAEWDSDSALAVLSALPR